MNLFKQPQPKTNQSTSDTLKESLRTLFLNATIDPLFPLEDEDIAYQHAGTWDKPHNPDEAPEGTIAVPFTDCINCCYCNKSECRDAACMADDREDGSQVMFKEKKTMSAPKISPI